MQAAIAAPIERKHSRIQFGFALLLALASMPLRADYKDDVGYTALAARMGGGTPTGAGITVAHVEAIQISPAGYLPNAADAEFTGKSIVDMTGGGTPSPHGTLVGKYFYGNLGIGKGITQVRAYEAEDWIVNRMQVASGVAPLVETFKVHNHSYAGYLGASPADAFNVELLRRVDMMIDRDGVTFVAGAGNGHVAHSNVPIYAQLTNGIVVGLTNGNSTFGLTNVDGAGRVKPDIVAPSNFTSNTAPMVAASAALLHQMAGSNAAAKRPETVKAMLMAGATKAEFPGWTRQNAEPLDRTFGAGELNIDNSVKIMQGGRQRASTRDVPVELKIVGWDYSEIAANGKNFYYFGVDTQSAGGEFSMIAAWNRHITLNAGVFSSALANINLKFYETDSTYRTFELLQQSISAVDNVEHIYFRNLRQGFYAVEVSSNLAWTYAIAWNYRPVFSLTATPEPASVLGAIVLMGVAAAGIRRLARRSKTPRAKHAVCHRLCRP